MRRTTPSQLALARDQRLLVKFTRPFEEGSVNGYVLEIGPRFFMVAVVDDRIRFNGFNCFRVADVRELRVPHKYAAFAEAALRRRGERAPKKPPVSVASLEELLLSADHAFPLVTIHREEVSPDVCDIGRVVKIEKGRLSLLSLGPDARWDQNPTEYRLSQITRVDFGCEYEAALHLVGGDPPGDRRTRKSGGKIRRV